MSKIIYADGLDKLNHKRHKCVSVKFNEPEWVVLTNLQQLLMVDNLSQLVRGLIFRAIRTLTHNQRTQLRKMLKSHYSNQ